VTPNFAFGGNMAIEGAASLSNSICKALKDSDGKPTQPAISAMFEEYQESHKARVKKIFTTCYYATRMQAWDSIIMRFIARYLAPWLGDEFVADHTATMVKGGAKLDYIPVPEHIHGSCAFDDEKSAPKRSLMFSIPWFGKGSWLAGYS
jgi:hypothetical protein